MSLNFDEVFRRGKRVRGKFTRVIRIRREEGLASQWGIVVGRKFGTAVKRNRAKRRVRNIVREYADNFPAGYALVLEILPAAAKISKSEFLQDVHEVIGRCLSQIKQA